MESSWLETHWARPLHLALVFCLALGLLQAVKLYLQRQRLLRDLRPFPSPPSHWFYGHQKVERWKGGVKEDAGKRRAEQRLLPSLPPVPPSYADLFRPSLRLWASSLVYTRVPAQPSREMETPYSHWKGGFRGAGRGQFRETE